MGAAARNLPVASDIIKPQSWDEPLPQVPSAIFVEEFVLYITDDNVDGAEDNDDFAWVDELVFYVESTKTGSTLRRNPIAWITRPGSVQRLNLETNRALNLVPYLLEGLQVTSRAQGRVPTDDVSLEGYARLGVDAL